MNIRTDISEKVMGYKHAKSEKQPTHNSIKYFLKSVQFLYNPNSYSLDIAE